MTTIADIADEVRMLELELQKLELNRRIAQVKAEPTIDERCIEYAGAEHIELLQCFSDSTTKPLFVDAAILKNLRCEVCALTAQRECLHALVDNYRDEISDLKAKNLDTIQARKEDSEVLMAVVDAIIDWNGSLLNPRDTIKRIKHILREYLNVSVISTEEDHCVTVKVGFLELP